MAPPYPRGSWFSNNLNLHYLRMLSHRIQLSCLFCFWEKDFLKIYAIYSYVKPPFMAPPYPPGTIIWTKLNLHYRRVIPHKLQLSWQIGKFSGKLDSEKKIFKRFTQYVPMWMFAPIVAQPYPGDHDLNKQKTNPIWGCFHISLSFPCWLVFDFWKIWTNFQ